MGTDISTGMSTKHGEKYQELGKKKPFLDSFLKISGLFIW